MPAGVVSFVAAALAIAVCVSLVIPVVLTDRTYIVDWTNHLWLIDQQSRQISELGHPSFFVSSQKTGLLYPFFAFYGGTLYALAAGLAIALGSSQASYLVWWAVGFAMAYGGAWWFARSVGLTRTVAHAPALVVVTSAYYLTNLYGRGAWPEFVATAAIPLVAAAMTALMRQTRVRLTTCLALLFATIILTGSHNITLLYATAFGGLTIVALAPAGGRWIWARRRRAGLVLALCAAATAVNAWFLVPDIAYSDEVIGSLGADAFYDNLSLHDWTTILFPWRMVPSGLDNVYDLYVQIPLLAAIWGLAAGSAHFRNMSSELRRAFVGVVCLLVVSLVMSTGTPLWEIMPDVFKSIQFPYRLQTYVVLLVAGLTIVGLLSISEAASSGASRRRWLGALIAALVLSVGLAEWQVWTARTYLPISAAFPPPGVAPPNWYDINYLLIERPPVLTPTAAAQVVDDPFDDIVTVGGMRSPDAETLFSTNVVLSPFIAVRGEIRAAGGDRPRRLVVRPTPGAEGSRFSGTVVTKAGVPVILGRIGTVLGFLGCLFLLSFVGLPKRNST
jgi:hypothetical protein